MLGGGGGGGGSMLALAMKLLSMCLKMSKAIILLYRPFKDKNMHAFKKKKKIILYDKSSSNHSFFCSF